MPKILITGNGFDLSLGLPTSYDNFITILKEVEENNSPLDFENAYSKLSSYSQIQEKFDQFELDQEKIKELKCLLIDNVWYQFFKDEFAIDTWIDFENRIEYVLKIILSAKEHITKNIFIKNGPHKIGTVGANGVFDKDVEITNVLKKLKLITVLDKGDRQKPLTTLNSSYLTKRYNHYTGVDLSKISEYLDNELSTFKRIFNLFFETFIFPLYPKDNDLTHQTIFSSIDRHYTFNYTPTFDHIYKKTSTQFLHGKIDSEENRIVLGINDIPNTELDRRHFLRFTKYYQKLNYDTDYIFLKEFTPSTINKYIIFFFGHSLDRSDADYINEVFAFVKNLKGSSAGTIVVIYHNENSRSKLLLNLFDIIGKDDILELKRTGVLDLVHINSEKLNEYLNEDISLRLVSDIR